MPEKQEPLFPKKMRLEFNLPTKREELQTQLGHVLRTLERDEIDSESAGFWLAKCAGVVNGWGKHGAPNDKLLLVDALKQATENPKLYFKLQSKPIDVTRKIIDAVRESNHPQFLEFLGEHLSHKDEEVRKVALYALRAMSESHVAALPLLKKALKNDDSFIQEKALEKIWQHARQGPFQREARAILEEREGK